MDWIEAAITTTAEGVEALTGCLYTLGVTGISIEDSQEFRAFIDDNSQYWDSVDEDLLKKIQTGKTAVKFYVPCDDTGRAVISRVKNGIKRLKNEAVDIDFGSLDLALDNVREEDWANNWKQYYKPIKVGDRLVVVPEWESYRRSPGEIVLTMDPGMAFGTGTHESTRLCLRAAQHYVQAGDRVLDLGCGSGILSIAALLLGAGSATAVDIDPVAVKKASENAELNGIGGDRLNAYCGDIVTDGNLKAKIGGGYGLVFANIVADVIIALAGVIPGMLRKGGRLITSGIITERREEVAAALSRHGFTLIAQDEEKGWSGLVLELQ